MKVLQIIVILYFLMTHDYFLMLHNHLPFKTLYYCSPPHSTFKIQNYFINPKEK